jgi:MYXO-CTERM domain-containing protein
MGHRPGTLAVAFAAFLATPCAVASAQSFNYPDFDPSTGLQANAPAAFFNTGTTTVARLTTGASGENGSIFTTAQYDITRFNTTFTIQISDGPAPFADGMCFVIQRNGPAAIGTAGGGSGLGYQGMTGESVAVKFDIYPNASFTGMTQDGADVNVGEITISPTIDFAKNVPFQVDITYDGTTLSVTITEVGVPANTVTNNYAIDLPASLGNNTAAHLGFTAATGGANAIHDVLSWNFATVYPVPAPTGVSATDGLQNQIVITWNAVANATSYEVFSSPNNNGPWTSVAVVNTPTPPATTYTHNVVGTYYYMVRATTALGTSGDSNVDQGVSYAPPRTNNHEEGLFGDKCSCGSSAGAGPGLAALGALSLLLAFRRRR